MYELSTIPPLLTSTVHSSKLYTRMNSFLLSKGVYMSFTGYSESQNLPRRTFISAACCFALLPLSAQAAYPEQVIKLFVGFPPGGGGDTYGRALANAMSKVMGKTMIIENRAGAGATLAASVVARSKPDGYSLLLVLSGNFSAAPAVNPELPYKVPGDFTPIAKFVDSPYGIMVAANSPYKNINDYLTAAKTGKMTFAAVGTGGASHLVMELLKQKTGLKMMHVPYKGASAAMNELLGGLVDSFINPYVPLMPQIKGGKMRVLAVSGNSRMSSLPDVPTFKEAGIDIDMSLWYGIVAPAGIPKDVLEKLTSVTKEALKDPELMRILQTDGGSVVPLYGDDFKKLIVSDMAKFKEVAKNANIAQ